MNLKELRNFDKDDILEMMGLQTKSSTGAMLAGTLATFGIGLLVGAGVGMLLRPRRAASCATICVIACAASPRTRTTRSRR